MAYQGMDVDAVERTARSIKDAAAEAGRVRQGIDSSVRSLAATWEGEDYRQFLGGQWKQSAALLRTLERELNDYAAVLERNVRAQREVSSASDSGSSSGGTSTGGSSGGGGGGGGGFDTSGDEWRTKEPPHDGRWRLDGGVVVSGEGSAHGFETKDGKTKAGAEWSGRVGVDGGAHINSELYGLRSEGDIEFFAGARADAEAGVEIGLDGVNANAKVGGFVGAEVSIEGEISGGGVKVGAELEGRVGIGATAEGNASFSYDKIGVDAKIGAALGFGGSVKIKFEVSPKEIVENINLFGWRPFGG